MNNLPELESTSRSVEGGGVGECGLRLCLLTRASLRDFSLDRLPSWKLFLHSQGMALESVGPGFRSQFYKTR